MIPAAFRHFARDRRANVAMMFGLMAVPLIFTVGMAIDYGAAARLKSKLNAAADSAALAGVTPAVMSSAQGDAASVTAATNMFNAAVTGLSRLTVTSLTVTPQDTTANGVTTRSVKVAYTAQSANIFAGILNMNAIGFGGSSTAGAAVPPNIDFYLLLDTSPSMALPATQTGISQMVALTSQQTSDGGQGCAFACHMSSTAPSNDNAGNPTLPGSTPQNPQYYDNYALAKNPALAGSLTPPIALRIDNVQTAVKDLTVTATNAMNNPQNVVKPTYRISINTFDVAVNNNAVKYINPSNNNQLYITSDMSQVSTLSSNIQLLKVYSNNVLTAGNNNSDEDTDFDTALLNISGAMPASGTGVFGSAPQEYLFIVTDGVDDKKNGSTGARQESVVSTAWCTTIKNSGVKIAVLYTTYFPLNQQPYYSSWYMSNIASFQTNIGPTLQQCASTGFYAEVSVGADISAALSTMFETAVAASSHLTQ